MTGRWVYCPMTQRRIAMKLTLTDRIRRWLYLKIRKQQQPDVYMVTGFHKAVWIRH